MPLMEKTIMPENAGDVKLKMLCVTKRGTKYYYPPSIPKERSNLNKKISIAVCILLITVDFFTNTLDFGTFGVYYALGFLVNCVFHFLYRIILVWEEFKHLKTRYNNSYLAVLIDAFSFSNYVYITSLFCLLGICIKPPTDIIPTILNFSSIVCFAPTIFLLGKFFDLNASPLNSFLQISQINGLDYGSGMAYSYFYGYLKLIMVKDSKEKDDKSLRDLMEIYEDQQNIEFESYKLFILIPLSLRCFVSLKNDYSPTVDESLTLPEKQITVAGVHNRVYKNAVYKILCSNNKKKVYVAAEYASPLKTFNDVVNSSGDHAVYYKKHKNEITLQFFLTLQKILKDTNCDEICELIFFEDSYVNEDNRTCYHDVGKVILTRLKEMKKHQREKKD